MWAPVLGAGECVMSITAALRRREASVVALGGRLAAAFWLVGVGQAGWGSSARAGRLPFSCVGSMRGLPAAVPVPLLSRSEVRWPP